MLIKFRRYRINVGLEIIFWMTALITLAFMKPGTDPHYSFCVLKFLGVNQCPGCGLGHSISFLFHGEVKKSFDAHPLGAFAMVIILARIFTLARLAIFNTNTKYALCKTTKTLAR
ncbi:MAG: DUF2752 domain-containing protein [Ginsengibacter sp.]